MYHVIGADEVMSSLGSFSLLFLLEPQNIIVFIKGEPGDRYENTKKGISIK